MVDIIRSLLHDLQIVKYCIVEEISESQELFFIKKDLDMKRCKDVTKYYVTIYKDFEKNGKKLTGSYLAIIFPEMDIEEVYVVLSSAKESSMYAENDFYEIPKGEKEEKIHSDSKLSRQTLQESAEELVQALFLYDTEEDAFINSAEIFMNKKKVTIVNSEGVDVGYIKYMVTGELIAQCINPQDVEYYQDFTYDNLDTDALSELVKESIRIVKDRATANQPPKTGDYTVILSGRLLHTLFMYYRYRSDAASIYAGYSNYKLGDCVQGQEINGEKLNLRLKPSLPFTDEGIKMIERELLEEGTLTTIHGDARFSYYLGVEPIGKYNRTKCLNGTVHFEDIKQEPYLHVVSFSDFQMDEFTGNFGGEIRLAYWYDGKNVHHVTGGSINGNITEAQKNMVFSIEQYKDAFYEGPYAVRLKNIKVAGEV